MGKRTRSNPLLRKPYEYTALEDRLHMPRGLSIPHVRGQHPLITLRQYGRTQPTVKQDWNRASVTIVRATECSNHRVWIRLRNRARAKLRLLDPTRDWSDDVLAEALRTVEAAGKN